MSCFTTQKGQILSLKFLPFDSSNYNQNNAHFPKGNLLGVYLNQKSALQPSAATLH